MNRARRIYLAALLLVINVGASSAERNELLAPGIAVRFIEGQEAATVLSARDGYIEAMSAFDRSARMKTDRAVTETEFRAFVARQVRPWSAAEREKVSRALAPMRHFLASTPMRLPTVISIIKTTGQEEGQAAYHRAQAIGLPQVYLDGPPGELERVVTHELFHVFTAYNPAVQQSLFAIIGFSRCGPLQLPPELSKVKITNPDAPINDACTEIAYEGKRVHVFPLLYSINDTYDVKRGGEFFKYIAFALVPGELHRGRWVPLYDGKEVVMLDPAATTAFKDEIGANTDYDFHPEEILAENFVLLVRGVRDVPTPRILSRVQAVLRAAQASPRPAAYASD